MKEMVQTLTTVQIKEIEINNVMEQQKRMFMSVMSYIFADLITRGVKLFSLLPGAQGVFFPGFQFRLYKQGVQN